MTAEQILAELKEMGSENIKRIFLKHGAKEPLYGVKVEDLKKIQKKIKKDHQLSLALYDTGVSDAQYLAGLIADEQKINKETLQHWAEKATWSMLSEFTVPWIAAESNYGYELGLQWIDSDKEHLQAAGWSTLASLVSIKNDDELDMKVLKSLLQRLKKEIHQAANRTRYTMNGFVISVGCYVKDLSNEAKTVALSVGEITVDMGGTACKVPYAPDYIQKAIDKGSLGKKKKMARC